MTTTTAFFSRLGINRYNFRSFFLWSNQKGKLTFPVVPVRSRLRIRPRGTGSTVLSFS